MKFVSIVLFFLLGLFSVSSAQHIKPVNSGELIRQAVQLHDSGEYKKALALYDQISRSDTNYVLSLFERAYTAEADSQYTRAIQYCEEGLALKSQREYEPELYNEYGNLLNDIGQSEKALRVFDTAMRKYPAYSLLPFNKGVVYLTMDKPAEAEELFKQSLMLNPYMYSAHFQLGLAALRQGKIVPAFLSFTGYLLMSPEGKYSAKSISLLDAIAKSKDDILEFKNKRKEPAGDSYALVEEIILSRIALEKAYKPLTSIDDPISRQIQVVFEKLEYREPDKDFWIQYYLPYYKHVFSDGKFELFINHIFAHVDLPIIQNYIKKNKKGIQELLSDAGNYFDKIRSTRELQYTKRDNQAIQYYFEDGSLAGKGRLNGKTFAGPWEFYFPAGNLKATGSFNESGQRDGEWVYYYANGSVKGKEHYRNGKLEGEAEFYFENGLVSSHETYIADQANGISTSYYWVGTPKVVAGYKMGKLDGERKEYYSNGAVHFISNYSNDLRNGNYMAYYMNGRLKEISQYEQGVIQGPYKSYYDNGVLSSEGQFTKDNASGEWKSYHENGKLKTKYTMVNGKMEGTYTEYHDNGQLLTTLNYKKGKVDGEALYYDKDGKLYSRLVFDNDALISAKAFDKSGKQIDASELRDKKIDMIFYNPDGSKKSHHVYNEKGNDIGTATYFYPSGRISETDEYNNGVQSGPSVTYHRNGNKKSEIAMSEGAKNGYYASYYANGKIESEGWYQDDQAQGEWLNYDELGNLSSRSYYLNNDLDGYREEYLPGGRKSVEQRYRHGWLEEMIQYDSTGKELIRDSFPRGTGKFVLLYPNGKKMTEANYVNGDFDGAYTTYYFDGSIESIQFYKKGLKDSSYISFNYGGTKSIEGQYRLGKRTGTWKYYFEGNKLSHTIEFDNDQMNGKRVDYYENGGTDRVVNHKDGERDGVLSKYDLDGSLIYQMRYDEGDPVAYAYPDNNGKPVAEIPIPSGNGKVKTFFPNGKVSGEWAYADGTLNGPDIMYYPNGQVRYAANYEYGNTQGPLKEYFSNGKIKSDYNYEQDNASGLCREYNEKGILKKECHFLNGNYHGLVKYYDDNGKLSETREYYYGKLVAVKK